MANTHVQRLRAMGCAVGRTVAAAMRTCVVVAVLAALCLQLNAPCIAAAETDSMFNASYTAYAGFASTAAESIVPGAVPVSAPASTATAWTAKTTDAIHATAFALRQHGQTTYAYVASGTSLIRMDAATGTESARVELSAAALGSCTFADDALVVATADGCISAYDEDFNLAWTSEAASGASAADWTNCSSIAYGAGCVFATFYSYADGQAEAQVAAWSSVDGSLLWERELGEFSAAREHVSAPALFYIDGALAATDGGCGLYLLDVETGSVLDAQTVGADGVVTSAALMDDQLVVAASGGTVQLWEVADGAINQTASVALGADISRCVPVYAAGSIFVADAQGTLYQLTYDNTSADKLTLKAQVEIASGQAIAALLPVAYGEKAASATLALYAQTLEGSLFCLTGDGVDISAAAPEFLAGVQAAESDVVEGDTAKNDAIDGDATVSQDSSQEADGTRGTTEAQEATGDSTADDSTAVSANSGQTTNSTSDAATATAPSTLIVNRDGSLLAVLNGQVTMFAADENQAQATPVGGSNGLDTLATTAAGLSLPNGVGLGAGVLIFALGFGAYAWIRNGGGRRAHDEGLDEWRSRGGNRGSNGNRGSSGSRGGASSYGDQHTGSSRRNNGGRR